MTKWKLTRSIFLLLYSTFFALSPIFAQDTVITGAGGTFPYPIYMEWAQVYEGISGVKIQYQPIGSKAGVSQLIANTVDFGASDKPVSDAILKQAGLIQFPMVIGGVVPIVNLPNITPGRLKMSGAALADIFFGKIKKWNDPVLAALNPGLTLPDLPITIVHGIAGSGTSFIFTSYLAKVSTDWKNKLAHEDIVRWPVGVTVEGNENVALYIKHNAGAIGFVEYSFARQLNYVSLKNKSGNFVVPTSEAFKATAGLIEWGSIASRNGGLTDVAGDNSWPICGATFVVMHTMQNDKNHALEILKFFDWCYKLGQDIASKFDYVPIPDKFITIVEHSWGSQIKDKNNNVIWKSNAK